MNFDAPLTDQPVWFGLVDYQMTGLSQPRENQLKLLGLLVEWEVLGTESIELFIKGQASSRSYDLIPRPPLSPFRQYISSLSDAQEG
jgi:hypothetical protein